MSQNLKDGIKSALWVEDYSCPCCDLFWEEWAVQQVELNGDNADAVYRDLREIMKDGFARYAYPLLGRLIELEPDSRRTARISQRRIQQLSVHPTSDRITESRKGKS